MSTQLILYPQSYEGTYNSVSSASLTEYLTNGINFTGINSTPDFATASSTPMQAAINSSQLVLGSWYRLHTTGGLYDATVAPLITGGELFLFFGTPSNGVSGLYQRLSGLAIGGQYDVVVNISTPASGMVNIRIFNGTVQTASMFVTANLNTITYTFTSPSTSPTFLISYIGKTPGSLGLESISIKDTQFAPGGVNSELSDGQVICDLYAEEEIPLTLSIDEFKNVAEKVQSYSKDFNLPATKRNNQIFNNMFEITRSYDDLIFNPYIKTQCVLKQDGFILFEGYLRMINVKEQDGEISYNVNLYSDVIALADVLKDQTFAELDFSELTHEYNKTSIQDSWYEPATGTGLPLTNPLSTSSFAYDALLGASQTNVLKYPFIDWTGQIFLASAGGTPGYPQLPFLESAFRPCIQLKYLINKIFAASGFNWTSSFFDSEDFEKLFMDFNWSGDNSPLLIDTTGQANVDVTQIATVAYSTIQTSVNNYATEMGYVAGIYTALNDSQTYSIDYSYFATAVGAGSWSAEFRWAWYHDSTGLTTLHNINPWTGSGAQTSLITGNLSFVLMAGDTLRPEFNCIDAATHDISVVNTTGLPIGYTHVATSSLAVTTSSILQTLRGELGQWDFLKGIMTMFNLVSMVDENNAENILIEPYADVFINNTETKILDWTDKVDASEMELTPLTNLNKNTIFKFVEDEDDYAFRQYKNSTSGYLYGSLDWEAQAGFTILAGEKEIIAEPFAATVSKPLYNQFGDFITPCIFAKGDDGTNEGFDNSPRIFYNNGIKDTAVSYYMPPQNGVTSSNQPQFLQFSHLSSMPPGTVAAGRRDFVFTSEQLIAPIGSSPVANLFNTYWLPYFNELYNPDTRTMTIKVDLSPSDINTFRFYDKCQIKNRTFRVNKIQYKPNELATVEFILIP
tara:strand:- start:658 stop:3387 length:2730 start_codon:yes stop_codon:yes gene_type:complete